MAVSARDGHGGDVPTGSDYRSTASRLTTVRDDLAALLRPVIAAAEGVVLGGPHRVAVTTTVDVSTVNVLTALRRLQEQIDEATRRAGVCDRYTAQLRAYRASDDPSARPPTRPASWADAG